MDVGADHGAVSSPRVQDFAACLRGPDGNRFVDRPWQMHFVLKFSDNASFRFNVEFLVEDFHLGSSLLCECPDG